jgi:hypothetical protein
MHGMKDCVIDPGYPTKLNGFDYAVRLIFVQQQTAPRGIVDFHDRDRHFDIDNIQIKIVKLTFMLDPRPERRCVFGRWGNGHRSAGLLIKTPNSPAPAGRQRGP